VIADSVVVRASVSTDGVVPSVRNVVVPAFANMGGCAIVAKIVVETVSASTSAAEASARNAEGGASVPMGANGASAGIAEEAVSAFTQGGAHAHLPHYPSLGTICSAHIVVPTRQATQPL